MEERQIRTLAGSCHDLGDWIRLAMMIVLSWEGRHTTILGSRAPLPFIRQVIRQAQRRVLEVMKVLASEQGVSLFEPHPRITPRHKAGTTVEFGRLVVFDEVERGIVTRVAVLEDQTGEQGQLTPALDHHQQVFGRAPRLVTGDR